MPIHDQSIVDSEMGSWLQKNHQRLALLHTVNVHVNPKEFGDQNKKRVYFEVSTKMKQIEAVSDKWQQIGDEIRALGFQEIGVTNGELMVMM